MDNTDFDYEDYFFCKYSSDLTDLFLKIKDISDSYCVNIFNTRYQTQNGTHDLGRFIFDKIILLDEINEPIEDNHELEEEENIV
jgi:hypothetical protein